MNLGSLSYSLSRIYPLIEEMDSLPSFLKKMESSISAVLYDSISSRIEVAYVIKNFSILFRNDIYVFFSISALKSVKILTSLLNGRKRSDAILSGLKILERGSISALWFSNRDETIFLTSLSSPSSSKISKSLDIP